MKVFLEVVPMTYICWSYCVIIYGMHFVLQKKHHIQESIPYGDVLQYSRFRIFTNSFFDAATYAIASSSGFALIKGLFLQLFYQIKYFEFFNEFDLATMLIVMIYLVYFSIMAMVKTTIEVLTIGSNRVETPEPIR
ncbi:hypothetical protein HUU42_14705 [bacterium]|nr:hypothetical protein [bacterium]